MWSPPCISIAVVKDGKATREQGAVIFLWMTPPKHDLPSGLLSDSRIPPTAAPGLGEPLWPEDTIEAEYPCPSFRPTRLTIKGIPTQSPSLYHHQSFQTHPKIELPTARAKDRTGQRWRGGCDWCYIRGSENTVHSSNDAERVWWVMISLVQ